MFLFAVSVIFGASVPARADAVNVTFTLTYFQIPVDPCFIQSHNVNCTLSGNVQFWLLTPGIPPNPVMGPLAVSQLGAGSQFLTNFIPTDPCFGAGACGLGVSFGGNFIPPNPIIPSFGGAIFDSTSALPNAQPDGPPILPILQPEGPPIFPVVTGGRLVLFDQPVVVGSWSATVTSAPEPASLLLLATGLGLVCARCRRRLPSSREKQIPRRPA